MLMDQSSRDDTLVGIGPPGATPAGAVSSQSSRDKRRKRSARGSSMRGQGRAISVGLHSRLVGRPGRVGALQRFVDHVQSHDRVWLARGIDIAEHWRKRFPPN